MSNERGSVSVWLQRSADVDRDRAAQKLWEHYHGLLLSVIRKRMGRNLGGADEEDVALSTLASALRGLETGKYPWLEDRKDLLALLLAIARNKIFDALKREGRQPSITEDARMLAELTDDASLPPQMLAAAADEFRRLMECLPDDQCRFRDIALRKMEGFTDADVAEELGCAVRTVERRLGKIRALWEKEGFLPAGA